MGKIGKYSFYPDSRLSWRFFALHHASDIWILVFHSFSRSITALERKQARNGMKKFVVFHLILSTPAFDLWHVPDLFQVYPLTLLQIWLDDKTCEVVPSLLPTRLIYLSFSNKVLCFQIPPFVTPNRSYFPSVLVLLLLYWCEVRCKVLSYFLALYLEKLWIWWNCYCESLVMPSSKMAEVLV